MYLDKETLRAYMNMEVQILLGSNWISGIIKQISKEIVLLLPTKIDSEMLGIGPASFHINSIVAIRQIKKVEPAPAINPQVKPKLGNAVNLDQLQSQSVAQEEVVDKVEEPVNVKSAFSGDQQINPRKFVMPGMKS